MCCNVFLSAHDFLGWGTEYNSDEVSSPVVRRNCRLVRKDIYITVVVAMEWITTQVKFCARIVFITCLRVLLLTVVCFLCFCAGHFLFKIYFLPVCQVLFMSAPRFAVDGSTGGLGTVDRSGNIGDDPPLPLSYGVGVAAQAVVVLHLLLTLG